MAVRVGLCCCSRKQPCCYDLSIDLDLDLDLDQLAVTCAVLGVARPNKARSTAAERRRKMGLLTAGTRSTLCNDATGVRLLKDAAQKVPEKCQ